MSFPNIPNITPLLSVTTAQTVPLLLASIALEELSLAHIMNAEAEKLQFALGTLAGTGVALSPSVVSLTNLIDLDTSIQRTLRDVIKKEMLLEFKFENVLDLIATLPVPTTPAPAPAPGPTLSSCPAAVTLSSGATARFTGLTNGDLTWNYEIVVPTTPTPNEIEFALPSPCAFTNFASCTLIPFGFCGSVDIFDSAFGLTEPGIGFAVTNNETTNTFSFTLNQQLPIGTIGAATAINGVIEHFNICGPVCS